MNPVSGSNEEEFDDDVVFVDDSNSVRTGRQPASEAMRKAIRKRLEREKELLELMKKMNEESNEAQSDNRPDSQ